MTKATRVISSAQEGRCSCTPDSVERAAQRSDPVRYASGPARWILAPTVLPSLVRPRRQRALRHFRDGDHIELGYHPRQSVERECRDSGDPGVIDACVELLGGATDIDPTLIFPRRPPGAVSGVRR